MVKIFSKVKLGHIREILLLGYPVVQYSKDAAHKYIDIFPHDTILENIRGKIRSILMNEEYDDIYIVWNNTGESWQFFRIAKNYFEKNKSKKPIILVCKSYLREMPKMLLPGIPVKSLSLASLDERMCIEYHLSKIDHHRVFKVLPTSHFYELEKKLQSGREVHFLDAILETLSLSRKKISYQEPEISPEVEATILDKARSMNLNIDKFIFLSPEAKSNKTPSNSFWERIKDELNTLGYDTYFNIVGCSNTISTQNKKCMRLSMEEGLALAKHANAIIGIRSGFMEVIASAKKNMYCIYTPFMERATPAMSADKVLKGFTLKKCPDQTVIYEYNAENVNEDDLALLIVNDFKYNNI